MNHYFISDTHLYPIGKTHPGRQPLKNFLKELSCLEPGKLWILGDLFDYWFEYKTVIPSGFSDILSLLKNLSENKWQVFFLPGNHDWWCGHNLEAETGMKIIYQRTYCEEINGKKTILAHGDGLGSGDKSYKLMRPFIRSAPVTFLFSMVHPTIATALAKLFSHTSKRVLRKQVDYIPDYLTEWVLNQADKGIELVVTGHTHCPSITNHENIIHVSLGDWINHFTYLKVSEGEIKLYEYQ